MSETVAIILRFREEDAEQFESAFKTQIYPLWEEFKAQGKFISASLTPALDGSEKKDGFRDYILHVETPSRAGHSEFDSERCNPRNRKSGSGILYFRFSGFRFPN